MKLARQSCVLAAASSNALGTSRRKITLISTSLWARPARSSVPIAPRCSVTIRAWANTKLIQQIVPTVTPTDACSTSTLWAAIVFNDLTATEFAGCTRASNIRWPDALRTGVDWHRARRRLANINPRELSLTLANLGSARESLFCRVNGYGGEFCHCLGLAVTVKTDRLIS